MNVTNASILTPTVFSKVFVYSLVSVNALGATLASVSNAIIIYAFVKTPTLRASPSFILILSLSLTDLGVGITIQPAFCFLLLNFLSFSFSKIVIYIFTRKVGLPLAFASIITLCLMAVDRFLAVKLFARYKAVVTSKKVYKAVIVVWLFAVAFSGLTMVPEIGPLTMKVVILLIILSVIVTVLLMVCTSYSIKQQMKRVRDLTEENRERTVGVMGYRRSIKTIYCIIAPFVLCYFPLFVLKVLTDVWNIYDDGRHILVNVALTLLLLNSSINPCIYFSRITNIRRAVMSILRLS